MSRSGCNDSLPPTPNHTSAGMAAREGREDNGGWGRGVVPRRVPGHRRAYNFPIRCDGGDGVAVRRGLCATDVVVEITVRRRWRRRPSYMLLVIVALNSWAVRRSFRRRHHIATKYQVHAVPFDFLKNIETQVAYSKNLANNAKANVKKSTEDATPSRLRKQLGKRNSGKGTQVAFVVELNVPSILVNIEFNPHLTSNVGPRSDRAQLLQMAKCHVIDEIGGLHFKAFDCADRLMRSLTGCSNKV
ncbi:hypothetical protein C8F04DRAFT_1267205 [Mycena alexandri]|uniref:Uncharacterized protein n=1 Tax=Mycena alexandri TaxID=1745969 RepID=A0AAD6WVY9_9AGAR|nr:hypothetical protein C8F04DRAFT_1267205 [Mycena alexandri]